MNTSSWSARIAGAGKWKIVRKYSGGEAARSEAKEFAGMRRPL